MGNAVNWDDIENVLYDGTSEEINELRCPVCKNQIYFHYVDETNSFEYGCLGCGHRVREKGCHQIPNCAYPQIH